ncbi:FMRFamide-like neuropeptides 1 [Neocloeon triangulifer]|uniref:FMRFamide-like neuropeptides 1 n=1 Tax=Neocloeon triangulifer TaxID=2078957 RepID=UPI00286F7FD6|nr:FMRFamide-like neuropeptides 1 [Neocloeon triangulifer]
MLQPAKLSIHTRLDPTNIKMHAWLVLLLAMAVADAASEPSKRADSFRNIELLSRRSALDKNFMRFGRGGDNFLRFGKSTDGFMRFGKASPPNDKANFIRFGRANSDNNGNFMRFGRMESEESDERPNVAVNGAPMVRLGRPSGGLDNNNFMRFGRDKQSEDEQRRR